MSREWTPRRPVQRRQKKHSVAEAILTWVYLAIITGAVVLIFLVARKALACERDAFIGNLEVMLHARPGEPIPANPSFNFRLQYLGACATGGGNYDVHVHRLR